MKGVSSQTLLGTEVIWQDGSAILRQTKNIIHLVQEYKVLELVKGDVRIPLSKADMDALEMPEESSGDAPYRNLLGELGWVASHVHKARHLSSPTCA